MYKSMLPCSMWTSMAPCQSLLSIEEKYSAMFHPQCCLQLQVLGCTTWSDFLNSQLDLSDWALLMITTLCWKITIINTYSLDFVLGAFLTELFISAVCIFKILPLLQS